MATAQQQRKESRPGAGAAPAASRRRLLASPIVAGLATALLLYCSFFPLNWGWLGWVAVVPLLALVAHHDKGVYRAAWLGGLAFAVPALQWVRLASLPMYATWLGLVVFISLHFLLFVWAARRLTRRAGVPLLLAAPVAWVALEYARAHVGIGFAWYYLGHTQHEWLPFIQIADLFGAYGVSFLVMMGNVILFEWGRGLFARTGLPWRPLLSQTLAVLALIGVGLGYGFWRLGQNEFETGPRVALLQGNLPQDIRDDPEQGETMRSHFRALADQAARAGPDLIVWSETCFIDWWFLIAPDVSEEAIP